MTLDPKKAEAAVLDTVESFVDTHPELFDADISFVGRSDYGELGTGMRVTIDGEPYLVQCKRGGWKP